MDALANTFTRFFDVRPAVTADQVDSVLRLRYQVYCVETGFEDRAQHPDGLERDEFDPRAVHSLLLHRGSGMMAGTVRLVLPDSHDYDALFPIEKYCGGIARPPAAKLQRSQIAEISRFCISKDFKRRMAESPSLWGQPEAVSEEDMLMAQRRLIPHITVGLFAAIMRMSAQHRIRYWYAVMEPALLRLLKRFGIHFTAIGPEVDYHGIRQPCFAAADEVLVRMREECRPVWELITNDGALWPPYGPQQQTQGPEPWLRELLDGPVLVGG